MRIPILFTILLSLPSAFSQKSPDHVVYFDADSYTISKAEQERFIEFASKINWDTLVSTIDLNGHTDSDASNDYNQILSENRVRSVEKLMRSKNIKNHITSDWFGEEKPLNTNVTAADKRANRRVEIRIERIPDYVEEEKGDIRDLYKMLEQKKQIICINPVGDTTIRLEQGTIIYFPPFAFGDLGGDCIEIRAKEFYKKSDMIMENLSTTSNGQLLESEGMIYLEASLNNSLIELAPGKEVTIYMPTDNPRNDVKIFNGERDEHTDVMNWILNSGVDINGIDLQTIRDCFFNRFSPDRLDCSRCKFFMCRIKRIGKGLKGTINKRQHQENKSLRQCQRTLRRNARLGITNPIEAPVLIDSMQMINPCAELDELFEEYGVDNVNDLLLSMNKEFMDKYGVSTLQELKDTLNAIKLNEIEEKFEEGTASENDMHYYMFNSFNLGWINVDAFSKLAGEKKLMNTDLDVKPSTDCKAVFLNVRGILSADNYTKATYCFNNVPMGNPCWIIGLKYANGKAYLSLVETESQPMINTFNFREMTLPEIKKALETIDR